MKLLSPFYNLRKRRRGRRKKKRRRERERERGEESSICRIILEMKTSLSCHGFEGSLAV